MKTKHLSSSVSLQTVMALLLVFVSALVAHAEADDVRLANGQHPCHGDLQVESTEVFFSEITLSTASAVCERLDCGSVLTLERNSVSPQHAQHINAICVQSKRPMSDCVTGEVSSSYQYRITCSESLRLRRAHRWCSGPLEVNHAQSWTSVCQEDFDLQDAEVACRELGCGAPRVLQGELYDNGEAPGRQEFQCKGSESVVKECHLSGPDESRCPSGKAVVLNCSEPVRLVGGSSRCDGTLELQYRGQWRPLSVASQNVSGVAAAVCPLLDCGAPVSDQLIQLFVKEPVWRLQTSCMRHFRFLRECIYAADHQEVTAIEVKCSVVSLEGNWNLLLLLVPAAAGLILTAVIFCRKKSPFNETTGSSRPTPNPKKNGASAGEENIYQNVRRDSVALQHYSA